jgi:6-phosphofructokinase 1
MRLLRLHNIDGVYMKKKILVLCSGGDAPGMNAAIRAVVRCAIAKEIEVFGAEGGYGGLVNETIIALNQKSVANCLQRGGTFLKTGRCLEFHKKSVRDQCRELLDRRGINGLIVLGGNGSFQGAALLSAEEPTQLQVIGIPCTIDNDIPGTDYCIGFDTARNTALQAIDKIRDTAFSTDRNFLIEVMGRSSGFLAVDVGIAGGAEMMLIPEFPVSAGALIHNIRHSQRHKMASIIVVAEGGKTGHSVELAEQIKAQTGILYTVCILGHTQRGGSPTAMDRKIGALMGAEAVSAFLVGESQKMTAAKGNDITMAPFPSVHQTTSFFADQSLLELNNILCNVS